MLFGSLHAWLLNQSPLTALIPLIARLWVGRRPKPQTLYSSSRYLDDLHVLLIFVFVCT